MLNVAHVQVWMLLTSCLRKTPFKNAFVSQAPSKWWKYRPLIVLHFLYLRFHLSVRRLINSTGAVLLATNQIIVHLLSSRDIIHRSHCRGKTCTLCRRRCFVISFPFHPPVLEPDLYLTFSQLYGMCDLNAPAARQIPVEVELFLQFKSLMPCVRRPEAFRFQHVVAVVCRPLNCSISTDVVCW